MVPKTSIEHQAVIKMTVVRREKILVRTVLPLKPCLPLFPFFVRTLPSRRTRLVCKNAIEYQTEDFPSVPTSLEDRA